MFLVDARTDTAVAEAVRRWIESYIETQRNEKGRHLAQQRARDFLLPFMGGRALGGLTDEDMRAYRIWLDRKPTLSPTTVWHVLADCRCFLRWCEEMRLVERSPFPRRLMPKLQEQPPAALSAAAVALACAAPEPYGFIARLGIGTGLRWGELVRLRADDLQNGEVVVHHTKSKRIRRVPITPELAAEIATRTGRLLPFTQGAYFARRLRQATGIAPFRPHQMRHSFACRWLDAGGSLAALQEMLGHASIVTTQRYARLSADMVKREAGRVFEQQSHKKRDRSTDPGGD